MKCLKRNQKSFYYCLLDSANAAIVDENGNRTGERIPVYTSAVSMMANVSPATGAAQTEQFGDLTGYDHVIVTDWMNCPIDESTVLFLEKSPEYTSASASVYVAPVPPSTTPSAKTQSYNAPLYDYVVRRVSKSLNSISIAVSKVNVNG